MNSKSNSTYLQI